MAEEGSTNSINITGDSLCKDKALLSFVEMNRYDVIISDTGKIFYKANDQRLKNLLGRAVLSNKVKAACQGTAKFIGVSAVDLEQWHDAYDRNESKTSVVSGRESEKVDAVLSHILSNGISNKASDIYLYIGSRGKTLLEYKVYGRKFLVDELTSKRGLSLANIAWHLAEKGSQFDKSTPCDVSFSFDDDESGNSYRIRGNSLPTGDGGVTIVFRVRDPKEVLPLKNLGYSSTQLTHLNDMAGSPGGLILVTGPTNSGKSTTLTSFMADVPYSSHMIEVADPVEIYLENCTHVELDRYHEDYEKKFKRVMASLVRQNPDVLVLGEIRDEETAAAAVSMGVQGKTVFSTLHSTTAVTVPTRLESLGVESHVLSLPGFISGIVSQNLVPIPCHCCSVGIDEVNDYYPLERDEYYLSKIRKFFKEDAEKFRFINSHGCDDEGCRNGVEGLTMVAEVYPTCLDISGRICEMINKKEYYKIPAYMKERFGCESKVEHARSKCISGAIDPLMTFKIVGDITLDNLEQGLSSSLKEKVDGIGVGRNGEGGFGLNKHQEENFQREIAI